MPETENNPVVDKVRELQRKLWMCAKQSKTRRFHALYDRIYRSDVLWEAWRRVRSNGGAAGVDRATLRSIEEQGVAQFLEGIQADLRAGEYRPSPVRRQYIPKADGKQRPLEIPTVRDRVVQMAAKIMIEPIFEADFEASSFGFRPKKSATEALEAIRIAGNQGHDSVVDADIKGYFDSIDQEKLMVLVGERISDRRVLKLIRQCGQVWVARETDSICRQFRGDGYDGSEGEGGAFANPVCDEQAGVGVASGEDADGGSAAWERKFRFSGVYDPQEAKYFAESTGILHAPLAVTEGGEATPGPGARDHRKACERGRREADHRQTEPRASRLGKLLPERNNVTGVSENGQLRLRAPGPLAVSAGRAASDAAGSMDSRTVSRNGSVSTAWYRAIPGASRISKIIVKPCAGKPHARFERGLLKTGWLL